MFTLVKIVSQWSIPLLLLAILAAGYRKKIKIYEVFIEGAMEGIKTTVKLAPYILAIFVAIGLFRNTGAINLVLYLFRPLLNILHISPELFTLGILKPLSGSAALGTTAELLKRYGPESVNGITASLIQGSCETTFYVLSVYLGAVSIKENRHLLWVGLASELLVFLLAVLLGQMLVHSN